MPFNVEFVRRRLPGRRIEWFPAMTSTMTFAARLAREGCPSGTIVGAEEQTAGIGRKGRSWYSEEGAGLYVSLVLRLPLNGGELPLVMLALGLATQRAIAEVTGLKPDLRWPNDVLLDDPTGPGKKCAGILAQFEDSAVVAGIGVNVSHTGFPPDIASLATSLRLAGAPSATREDLLIALARAVDDFCKLLAEEGPDKIREQFTQASSFAQGRRVRVEQDDTVLEGVTCGLDPSGFLLLKQDNGTEIKILAGGVRPI
jgi:BirA family biotin operon repressor/biotin-[acetyl-CoA-carboxylase] ligase